MQHRISEFAVGLLFGIGLILSGMTDPGKVIGFLDLFGNWDPSLALVMGGAIMVGVFAFAIAKKRTSTFLGGALSYSGTSQGAVNAGLYVITPGGLTSSNYAITNADTTDRRRRHQGGDQTGGFTVGGSTASYLDTSDRACGGKTKTAATAPAHSIH